MHLHTCQVLHFAHKNYAFHNLTLLFSFLGVDIYANMNHCSSIKRKLTTGSRFSRQTLQFLVTFAFRDFMTMRISPMKSQPKRSSSSTDTRSVFLRMSSSVMPQYVSVSFHTGFSVLGIVLVRSLNDWRRNRGIKALRHCQRTCKTFRHWQWTLRHIGH